MHLSFIRPKGICGPLKQKVENLQDRCLLPRSIDHCNPDPETGIFREYLALALFCFCRLLSAFRGNFVLVNYALGALPSVHNSE